MKRIGLIVAMDKEVITVFNKLTSSYREDDSIYKTKIFNVNGKEIYLVKSGIGLIASAAATQYLITKYNVEGIINFGVVGALVPNLSIEDVVLVKGVCHYEFDLSPIDHTKVGQYEGFDEVVIEINNELLDFAKEKFPNLPLVNCASGDRFVDSSQDRERLNKEFNCQICEMESAAIFFTALKNNVPTLFIKGVSDGFNGQFDFNTMVQKAVSKYLDIICLIIKEM